jgi:hypothetical protein
MAIRVQSVINGGMIAGFVMNLIDMLISYLTQSQWRAEMENLSPAILQNAETWFAVTAWVVFDFIMGIILVATYASIRPRYGPGPGTAVRAALLLGSFATCILASFYIVGIFSLGFFALTAGLSLANLIVSAMAGAYVYREDDRQTPRPV